MSARSRKIAHLIIGLSVIGMTAGCATPKQDSSAIARHAPPTRPPVRDVELESAPEARRFLAAAATPAAGRVRLASHGSDVDEGESAPAGRSSSAKPSEPAAGDSAVPQSADLDETAHSIDLPTVLELTSGRNPQVAFARARIDEAFAQLDRAQVLWLPSLRAGVTYDKHEGSAQAIDGTVFNVSRSALFSGFGGVLPGAATPAIPGLYANFQLTDAIFQPRIAQRTAAARQSAATAAANDALLAASLAYLDLLRARQDLAIANQAREHTRQLAELTGAYAETGKGNDADHDRALAELAIRENDAQSGRETVRVASARLAQQLNLDPLLVFEPQEPIIVPIEFVATDTPPAELVARGLRSRPEIAESRHLVAEAVERLEREKHAPLIPSVLLGIGYGGFGGGTGGNITHFNNSFDSVVGAFWEVRNLGFGERAARCEAQSRIQQAEFKQVAALDQVAREVVEAHVQARTRKEQIATAEQAVGAALSSYERNLERIKNVQGLPLEALQSIQALTQARREYLRAVASYNEAQLRLQRALGWPAESP
jgi:outer membrane protein TolC